jgi:hypothetical protein
MIPAGIKNDPKKKAQNRLETRASTRFQPNRKKRSLLDIFQGSAL